MISFISSLISFMKGIQVLREIGDLFANEWAKYDIARMNNHADSAKEEIDKVTAKIKKDETKDERRASLRRFTGID